MDTRSRAAAGARSYEDFEPQFDWVRAEGSDTLLLDLLGFKKEHLKVQVDIYGNLKISGERPLDGNRWSRFHKEFSIPENCSANEIRAKFESGILYVILPKLITQADAQDQPTHVQEPALRKPEAEPKPIDSQDATHQKPASSRISDEPDDTTRRQPEEKNDKPADATKDDSPPKMQEKEKVQTNEAESERDRKDDVGREKEPLAKRMTPSGHGSWLTKLEYGLAGLRLELNKPRGLVLNVAVAVVVCVGLAMFVTYKLRKSIESDNN